MEYTLEILTHDEAGGSVPGVEISPCNVVNHQNDPRYSDGNGYSNHAFDGAVNDLIVFTTNGYQIVGSSAAPVEGPCYYRLTAAPDQKVTLTVRPFKRAFRPAPRVWKANMCGLRIPGLPPVPGGAADPSLFLSWFYMRYDTATRATIRAAMRAKGYTHWLLSWPDDRTIGITPAGFLAECRELIAAGFYPCPMLYSKDVDPPDVPVILANMQLVIPLLVGVVPLVCIGWELSIKLTPTQVQQLIDAVAPQFTPGGTRVYVHFQEGYFSFPQPGNDNASFWKMQIGKLTGVLYQRRLSDSQSLYQAHLADCTTRCAGNDGMPADSGFGHPFDTVALEITAMNQFNGQMTEAEGNIWGDVAIATPPQNGPAGAVTVMGSGNGQS